MGKTNRNQPINARSSDATTTLFDFERRYPDDASCLDALIGMLYPKGIHCPKCEKVTKHHRVKSRTCFECQFCGHQEYPMKGTIFEGSSTSLRLWFYAIYLMASTRCGISAKQLEREIGVSYPTAWRMFNKIRSLLTQDEWALGGTVELDDAFIGGIAKWRSPSRSKDLGVSRGRPALQTQVTGMAERGTGTRNGQIRAEVAEGPKRRRRENFIGNVETKVLPGSTVYTDDAAPYGGLEGMGYKHSRVAHSQKVYVSGDVHTNTVEGFWALLKRGIGGTYHSVSTKHLHSYLDEYAFRYNNREAPKGMFEAFLGRIEKAPPDSAS